METAAPADLLGKRSTFWVVCGITLSLFLITNLPWQLDDFDQAKQAFTSFEMVNEGHWIYERTPNEFVATKPPAAGWISALLYAVTGSWDLAWRLPSLLAALALLAILSRIATNTYGTAAGLIGFAALGLNFLSPRLATLVRTDMLLALVVFLLGWKIWEKIRRREPWRFDDRLQMFVLLTAAMLIKGPIVYAFLLPGLFLFHLRSRPERAEVSAWFGLWPWLFSLTLFLLWAVGGIIFISGFYQQVVVREFAGRFGETVHRPQPVYFYLPHLLGRFAPWSVLVLALAFAKRRGRKPGENWHSLSPETFWLVCWSVGGIAVMSLIPSKRVDRIFPVIPPLCLLLAAQLGEAWRDQDMRLRARRWSALALIAAAFAGVGYDLWKVRAAYIARNDGLVRFCAAVREQAEARHWKYETMKGRHEGLLLYLRRTHFLSEENASAAWSSGQLDALVVPREQEARMMRDLPGSIPTTFPQAVHGGGAEDYVLLRRSGPPL